MYDELKQIISTGFQVPVQEIMPECTLTDLGLDSLDVVELALTIEKELGVSVTDDELAEAGQVKAIAELLTNRSARV